MTNLFPGLREVFVKDPNGNRVGYFTDVTKALAAVENDGEYRAVWFSLNICPDIPAGFEPNRLYKASGRFKKTDYSPQAAAFGGLRPEAAGRHCMRPTSRKRRQRFRC